MPKKIYKYPIGTGDTIVSMPSGARVINAALQHGKLVVLAVVDTAKTLEPRAFHVYMTGESVPDEPGAYINTVIAANGIVGHIFETALEA